MRGLKICLWVTAVVCLLSVAGTFLSLPAWEKMAKYFGAESVMFPDSPLVEYIVRLMSLTYAAVGVFFLILALQPMDYGVMVLFAGVSAVILGIACAIIGMIVKMPVQWFLGDSLPCLILGVLILVFWQRAKRAS